jgi:hypothetical protein
MFIPFKVCWEKWLQIERKYDVMLPFSISEEDFLSWQEWNWIVNLSSTLEFHRKLTLYKASVC